MITKSNELYEKLFVLVFRVSFIWCTEFKSDINIDGKFK